MSLTSYRAAPPRESWVLGFLALALCRVGFVWIVEQVAVSGFALARFCFDLGRLGGDRLSHALRRSTIGAGGFHVRVRDGIGCLTSAVATKPSKIKGGPIKGGPD